MSIFEYDEEKHMKSERKEWREIGQKEGIIVGREEGSDNLARLLNSLMDAGKTEEANRVISDSDFRKKLLDEYLRENAPYTDQNCLIKKSKLLQCKWEYPGDVDTSPRVSSILNSKFNFATVIHK